MMIYVMLEHGQPAPVAVYTDPNKAREHMNSNSDEDELKWVPHKQDHSHRLIIGEWRNAKSKIRRRLVAYDVS